MFVVFTILRIEIVVKYSFKLRVCCVKT